MTHYKLGKEIKPQTIPSKVKVAIVGAGMSGLYSAWRLQNEANIDDIAIFERSNRTGGRLDSDLIHFKDKRAGAAPNSTITVKEEQGGMRFLFEGMDDLMALFLTLGLEDQIVPFPMNSDGNNRLFFRGTSFSAKEAQESDYQIWSALYNLDANEQGVNPKSIINVVFNRILQVNPQFDGRPTVRGPEFWQAFRLECQWQDKPLYEWSLWDLLSDMGYSQECITMLYRVLGFNGTFLSKMNAGVAYQLLEDFPASAEFKTFKDGFSTLPNALVDKIGKDNIHLKTQIDSISFDANRKEYILHYSQADQPDQPKATVAADKVILALPRLALEKLFLRSDAFQRLEANTRDHLWDTLQSTTNQPLLKINLYYDSAWWGTGMTGRPAVSFGPNFADLPTGSVYPFYALDDPLAAALMYDERDANPDKETQAKLDLIEAQKYSRPAALTIYCDYLNINFWSALQNKGALYHHPREAELIEQPVPSDIYPATEAVVNQATKFFKDIFNTHYVPEPILTSARIWEGNVNFNIPEQFQFGFGVHQWAIGTDDKEAMSTLVEPLPQLYTCGEAFSDYQGWVEGALRSADLALNKGFGLAPFDKVFQQQNPTGKTSSEAIQEAYLANSDSMIMEYIDPNFKPNCANKSKASRKQPESVLGVDLSYFDTSEAK